MKPLMLLDGVKILIARLPNFRRRSRLTRHSQAKKGYILPTSYAENA